MNVHAQMKGQMLIGGEMVAGEADKWIESVNPANEERIGEFVAGDAADVNKAVAAAEKAQPAWAALDIKERGKYLKAMAKRIRERGEELLHTEVMDTGNTITKMKADIEGAAEQLEWYTGLAIEMKGETVPASSKHLHITVREPYGVVARIVPFNHPLSFAARGLRRPADRRQHGGDQAAGDELAVGPHPGRDRQGDHAARHRQHRHRQRHAGRRRDRAASARQAHRVHRLGPDRHGDPARGGGRRHQGADAGAWRQESVHRLSGCRSRQGRGCRHRGHELRLVGTVLRLDQPADAARAALQEGARPRHREGRRDQDRRSDSIRSRRWGR